MRDSEVITGIIDLLAVRSHWTRHAAARSVPDPLNEGADWRTSNDVHATSSEAQSWCIGGAAMRVIGASSWYGDMDKTMDRIFERSGDVERYGHFAAFNNSPAISHEDLMMFLKTALYDAQADEARAAIEANGVSIEANGV